MSNPPRRSLFVVLALTLLWAGVMQCQLSHALKFPASSPSTQPSCYWPRPILTIELVCPAGCFKTIVDGPNAQSHNPQNSEPFRTNTCMDFAFILLYLSVFLLFAAQLKKPLSKFVALAILISAAFDGLENWRILACLAELDRSGDVHGILPFRFSATKWVFLGIALCLAGAAVWIADSPTIKLWHKFFSISLVASGLLTIAMPFSRTFVQPEGIAFLVTLPFLIAWSWLYSTRLQLASPPPNEPK